MFTGCTFFPSMYLCSCFRLELVLVPFWIIEGALLLITLCMMLSSVYRYVFARSIVFVLIFIVLVVIYVCVYRYRQGYENSLVTELTGDLHVQYLCYHYNCFMCHRSVVTFLGADRMHCCFPSDVMYLCEGPSQRVQCS